MSAGAFYTYVAEGLGKPLGVGAAYCAMIAYTAFAFGLAAACGYFDEQVFLAVGLKVGWTICAAVSLVITGLLNLPLHGCVLQGAGRYHRGGNGCSGDVRCAA